MKPVLLHLPFGVPLYSYGLLLTASVLAGRGLAIHLAARVGIARQLADRCATWTFVGALLGARLLYVLTNPGAFASPLDVVACWEGGVVAYGGFLGGLAAAAAFCRAHKIPLLVWADCVAPALCIGLALTRVGCFLAGCDFGRAWSGPWAVRFPAGSPAFLQQRALGELPAGAVASLPVHPTQLYESLAGFGLLFLVLTVRRRQSAPGHALAALTLGYGALRFLIEMVRADADRGAIGPWSTSQLIAIATIVAASALLAALRRGRGRSPNPTTTLEGGSDPCNAW